MQQSQPLLLPPVQSPHAASMLVRFPYRRLSSLKPSRRVPSPRASQQRSGSSITPSPPSSRGLNSQTSGVGVTWSCHLQSKSNLGQLPCSGPQVPSSNLQRWTAVTTAISRGRGSSSSSSSRSRSLAVVAAATEGEVGTNDEDETFVVTTPLYYVNAAPHMGSAYPTIAADALARFQRLRGRRVIFVTGTDEHGEKIALAAAAGGRGPKEHCDAIAEEYKKLWRELNIAYDRFIRTTNERHEAIVEEFFRRVEGNGDIYRAQYSGLYCVNCEEYKDEKELLDDKKCPVHLKPCDERKEDNLFFALSKYQLQLEALYHDDEDFVRPSFRKNEVLAWVSEGARDFSISRAAVDWGIPVPSEPSQTIYVWFDALLGYISALLDEKDDVSLEQAVSNGWPANVHIIGKDILRFHAVYWPAMLMSAGLKPPRAVFGHGFLTKDGLKMGKSLGNTIDPSDLVTRFGADAVRYFFLKEIEFGKDGDFSEERFVNIVNANLANTIGNLLNRTLGLLKKNCDGIIPIDAADISEGNALRAACEKAVLQSPIEFEALSFSTACDAILEIGTAGNLYLEEKAPWTKLKKGGQEAEEAKEDLVAVLEAVRITAVLISPVTPDLSRAIYRQLAFSDEQFSGLQWRDTAWGKLSRGQQMAAADPVFKRIGEEEEGKEKEKRPQKSKNKQPAKTKTKTAA